MDSHCSTRFVHCFTHERSRLTQKAFRSGDDSHRDACKAFRDWNYEALSKARNERTTKQQMNERRDKEIASAKTQVEGPKPEPLQGDGEMVLMVLTTRSHPVNRL